jgi:hypothetical protein
MLPTLDPHKARAPSWIRVVLSKSELNSRMRLIFSFSLSISSVLSGAGSGIAITLPPYCLFGCS